jgi:multisubunit Na+/H+ antiporter MnhF subunit
MNQQSCKSSDLVLTWNAIWLWCLPVIALIVGSYWQKARLLLWIPAFLVMGAACFVNAARCGRVHCYITGPLSLLAIVYVLLAEFHLVPIDAGYFLDSILAISILAFLAEIPFGKYRGRLGKINS